MKKSMFTATLILAVLAVTPRGYAQHWSLGGNMGLSLLGGSAGFHVTPTAELLFNRDMGLGSEFSINTQFGVPLLWYPYFKYYFGIRNSKLRPYANGGPVLILNIPDAPYFGILFGGGVNIPVAHRLYLAPDVVFGPVFGVGGRTYNLFLYGNYYGTGAYSASSYSIPGQTIFAFSVRGGIRYDL